MAESKPNPEQEDKAIKGDLAALKLILSIGRMHGLEQAFEEAGDKSARGS